MRATTVSAVLVASIATGLLTSALASADAPVAAFTCATVGVLGLLIGGRGVVGHWAALVVLFCGFFALYGLSGPLHALMGERLSDLFTFPYRTSAFLVQQGFATAGLAAGLLAAAVLRSRDEPARTSARDFDFPIVAAVGCVAVASIFELINFVRVGGIAAVALGKAIYQSRAAEMTLTLPSDDMATLGLAMAALWFARFGAQRSARERLLAVVALLVAATPVLAIAIALGRRGPLFAWVLVLIVGAAMYAPVRRIPARALGGGIALIVVSGLLYASRAPLGYAVATGDWEPFQNAVTDVPRIVSALNPAESEFGAAFGNYSEFDHRGGEPRRYGTTYVKGLATLIPGSIYPGRKPIQITYEFRDRYFPSEASRGAIAGTGFSSILESYLNFGSGGVVMMYALFGWCLVSLERLRGAGPYGRLAYLLLIPITQSFHRSPLSVVLSTTMLTIYLLVATRGTTLALALVRQAIGRRANAPSRTAMMLPELVT